MSETVIEPDTKDWTWVLDEACPECGFEAGRIGVEQLAPAIRDDATGWERTLAGEGARTRPRSDVWSPTEYGAHVRDVHLIFAERIRLMLAEDEPTFANWDQDATALEKRYDLADPETVAGELLDAATVVADLYEAVPPDAWGRRGLRSNGSVFTVESLGRYHLHDLVHHTWDVTGARWGG
ncbi:MAG: DinB family protein [Nocardioides sp.]